jgi:hypothetical protein
MGELPRQATIVSSIRLQTKAQVTMAAKDQFTLRWGIMATSGIADLFARDLHKDPGNA